MELTAIGRTRPELMLGMSEPTVASTGAVPLASPSTRNHARSLFQARGSGRLRQFPPGGCLTQEWINGG